MHRYFLEISFDGTSYHGWQIQQNAKSIQEEINKSLGIILQSDILVTGAGRTDAGVHSTQMYCHFDADLKSIDADTFVYKMNTILPKDIAVKGMIQVSDSAHARFDALSRTYRYRIVSAKDPFEQNRSWHHSRDVNIENMNKACEILKKYEHFSSFSKTGADVKTDICNIMEAYWLENEGLLEFVIKADRFLRNMVRAIVGTMLEVGYGNLTIEKFKEIVESEDRSRAGFSAPACGLYLEKIEYPYELIYLNHV